MSSEASSSGNFSSNATSSSVNSDDPHRFAHFQQPHVIIAVSVVVLTIVVALIVKVIRLRIRYRDIHKVPRDIMPLLRPGDVPTKNRNLILAELVHSRNTVIEPSHSPPPIGGVGWGDPRSDEAGVHYKTSIAKTYLVLEQAAMHRDRALSRPPTMNVRDYVELLVSRVPTISQKLAEFYVEEYERARFGQADVTADEYRDFMTNFGELLQGFEGEPEINEPATHHKHKRSKHIKHDKAKKKHKG